MSTTGIQSPLGVNVLSSVLQDTGLGINAIMKQTYGISTSPSVCSDLGNIVNGTCLRLLTYAIRDAFVRGEVNSTTYNNLISIGSTTVPALGNSPPSTYNWSGYPNWASNYNYTNEVTSWGYLRLFALQGYNEFNYNSSLPKYKDFLTYTQNASSFVEYTNKAILSSTNSTDFLDGTYSNMNDLISADITGISLSTTLFGQDLIATGKAIDLKSIQSFGLPSNLVRTLASNNAITQTLSLTFVSSGINSAQLNDIINNAPTTPEQERTLYACFVLTVGDALKEVLILLNCKTKKLESLADLLNPAKLFPNSLNTLTVPLYNTQTNLPTNSKTYYPIYINGSTNSALSNTDVVNQVGSQIPTGTPINVTNQQTSIEIQAPAKGFGSYLYTIIPSDIAISAGAFGTSVSQVRNINNVPIEKFAQVVSNIETTSGLNVNGTAVPVDKTLANQGIAILAKGSGPYGTYTMSDFIGCITGLPYNGLHLQSYINQVETPALYNIYKQLYLAVTWERATVTVQYTTYQVETDPGPPPSYTTYYHVTGLTITVPGGGYGREGASAPTITISNGGSGTTTIGTDDTNITTFGRVTTVSLSSAGTDGTTIPTATVAYPPGGTSFPNSIVQGYIDDANAEIATLVSKSALLNSAWNDSGTQLTIEQRAISTAFSIKVPLASSGDKVDNLSMSPTAEISFVNVLPQFGLNTAPHMEAQSVEAMADFCTTGGQSMVALMRESRNQARLLAVGVPLDNTIDDAYTPDQTKQLIANGTLSGSKPATLVQDSCDVTTGTIKPNPYGNYNNNTYNITNSNYGGTTIGTVVDTGSSNVPGSFASSPYTNLIPTTLNTIYSSNNTLPSTYTINQAIDEVVRCNCDCWKIA